MHLIDLTRTFTDSMPVYPGDPSATLRQICTHEEHGFCDHVISSGMHVGTHIDAPIHMVPNAKRMDEIDPACFTGAGRVVDVRGQTEITAKSIAHLPVVPGGILLFYTGWGEKFGQKDYFENFPVLTEDAAKHILSLDVSMIGMDTPSPDTDPYPVHKILLGKEVLIIENLTNLDALLECSDFTVQAFPMKYRADAAPARVIASVQS